MTKDQNISEIFKALGKPTVTYVRRDNGALERRLDGLLGESGQLCLITGPSKTGKTTLYREVLNQRKEVPLVVACDRSLTCAEIWKKALEAVDFDRVEARTTTHTRLAGSEGEISGKITWAWLAQTSAKVKMSISRQAQDSEFKKIVLAEPSADLLIPILQNTKYVLVIEDFHYLIEKQKEILFQQWKRFVDAEVSVIVLGTTHRAVDIANSNRDLIGRIGQINIDHWSQDDLDKITKQRLEYLNQPIRKEAIRFISSEAVGLPIIVQQACLEMFSLSGVTRRSDLKEQKFVIDIQLAKRALHSVAKTKYTQFESYYTTLIKGPRESARKYKTYEISTIMFRTRPN
jgi:molybdopterin-guanine dinucleotide biosynthesis protein